MAQIEKVYMSGGREKIVVLWVSRHPPLKAQIEELERKLGSVIIYQLSGVIPNAEFIIDYIKKLNARYTVPVLPLSMIARLSELAKQHNFIVLLARMNNIATTKDIDEAKKLVNEAPDKRTLATHADGLIRIFEFERFDKLVKIELITEPL